MSADIVGYVWTSLRAAFGAAFVLEHGEVPDAIWRAAIAKLTAGELEQGLAALLEKPGSNPPNCSEFVRTCRNGARVLWERIPRPAGPPPASASTVERALARIRRRHGFVATESSG
jgi:hypothetical protein